MRKITLMLVAAMLAVMAVLPAAAQDERNLVEAAQRATGFDTLLAAAEAAGLADTLANDGPFTVFAPTDGGFAAALANLGLTAEELLADTETLTTILSFHVVNGELNSTDILAAIDEAPNGVAELTTLGGEVLTAELRELPVAVEEGEEPEFTTAIYLNGSNTTVFLPDISASNGVIHAISGVLLPPSMTMMDDGEMMAEEEMMATEEAMEEEMAEETMEEMGTIVDVAANTEGFSTLVAAVEAAGLVDALSADGTLTVFAPTDDAFAAALDALGLTAEELLADTDTLTAILTYHVLGQEVDSAAITTLAEDGNLPMDIETLNGELLTVDVTEDGDVMVNDATVVTADVEASNGVIHVIDSVLLPPSMTDSGEEEMMATEEAMEEEMAEETMAEMGTIVDVAANTEGFSTLVAAVEAAGLVGALSDSDSSLTVFAPTDDAFAAALDALGITAEELLADTDTLTAILTYHVLGQEVDSGAIITLAEGGSLPIDIETLNGELLTVDVTEDGDVMVNDATVVAADVEASNGVIHVIDSVILPPSMTE